MKIDCLWPKINNLVGIEYGGGGDLELEPLQKSYTGGLSPCRRFAGGGLSTEIWYEELR